MFGGFEAFVAWRYLLTRKRTGFISLISLISVAGIALGVAALIIVLSLMNGFTKELRTRLVGMDGHIWISYWGNNRFESGMPDYREVMALVRNLDGVEGVSPFCSYMTAASDRMRNTTALQVRGVDLDTVESVSTISDFMVDGVLRFDRDESGLPGIVLGDYLQGDLAVDIGDSIIIYGVGTGDIESMLDNMALPPIYKFRVQGVFHSGYYDYDNSVAFINLGEAQRILQMDDRVSGLAVKLHDAFAAEKYTGPDGILDQVLGGYPYYYEDWITHNGALFAWMKIEKWSAFIVLSLIVLVAAFNIVSTLIMMVMDKTREVGILKSMGATRRNIGRIFVYQGLLVGVTGVLMGSTLGYVICYIQDKYKIISLPADIYFVSAIPMDLQMRDFLAVTITALFLCWLSSFYPARKAAQLDPVDAIRSE